MHSGKLSSLFECMCLATMLNPVVGVGHGLDGAIWLSVWGWTVTHLLTGKGVSIGWGVYSSSGCCLSCSLRLGFGCCCSWHCSCYGSCVAHACCDASRPQLSYLAVLFLSSSLACWAGATSLTLAFTSTSGVMSAMPVCHSTLSFCNLPVLSPYLPAVHSCPAIVTPHAPPMLPAFQLSCPSLGAAASRRMHAAIWFALFKSSRLPVYSLTAMYHSSINYQLWSTPTGHWQQCRTCMVSLQTLRQPLHRSPLLPPCPNLPQSGVFWSFLQFRFYPLWSSSWLV